MKSEAPVTVASTLPVTADKPVVVQPHKIPLAAKVAGIAFLAVFVPIYLHTYFFTPPAGAPLANPNLPININYLYGFNDHQPQHWVNQNLYVILWLGALWLVAFLPTHLALCRIFAVPPPVAGRKLPIRFL